MRRVGWIALVVIAAMLLADSPSALAQFMRDHDKEGGLRGFHDTGIERRITRSFESDAEARAEFARILSAVGLTFMTDRISLRASAQTSNAEAGIGKDGERFIFYNVNFMQRVKQQTAEHWSLVSILAHEVGHHLAMHTVIAGRHHEFELEADAFSGFVLRRLGATLDQAEAAMRLISPKQAGPTHPGLDDRLQAIAIGWTNGGADGPPGGLKEQAAEAKKRSDEETRAKAAEAERQRLAHLQQQEEARKRAEAKRKADEEAARREPALSVKPGSGESFRDCQECPEMVMVPAGSFMMGSTPAEIEYLVNHFGANYRTQGPQHRVTLARAFAVGKFEVTFAEWDACVSAGGCSHRPSDEGWGRGRRPAINVLLNDAEEYTSWLSRKTGQTYRLPTEAEWEYAARAGTTTAFWWGSSISTSQANYDGRVTYGGSATGEFRQRTVPVDSFAANPWGLYNVHGNVSEWVQDCWNESFNGAPSDGSAWTDGECNWRVARGGSWLSDPQNLHSAHRIQNSNSPRNFFQGFRVVRTLTP